MEMNRFYLTTCWVPNRMSACA